jgi:hypothetical protein
MHRLFGKPRCKIKGNGWLPHILCVRPICLKEIKGKRLLHRANALLIIGIIWSHPELDKTSTLRTPISLRPILMLFYLCLILPYDVSFRFPNKKFVRISYLPLRNTSAPLLNYSDLISLWTKNNEVFHSAFFSSFLLLPSLVTCIFLSKLLSQVPSLCFPLKVGNLLCVNEFSESYKLYDSV